jgi:hypothetical protein
MRQFWPNVSALAARSVLNSAGNSQVSLVQDPGATFDLGQKVVLNAIATIKFTIVRPLRVTDA